MAYVKVKSFFPSLPYIPLSFTSLFANLPSIRCLPLPYIPSFTLTFPCPFHRSLYSSFPLNLPPLLSAFPFPNQTLFFPISFIFPFLSPSLFPSLRLIFGLWFLRIYTPDILILTLITILQGRKLLLLRKNVRSKHTNKNGGGEAFYQFNLFVFLYVSIITSNVPSIKYFLENKHYQ